MVNNDVEITSKYLPMKIGGHVSSVIGWEETVNNNVETMSKYLPQVLMKPRVSSKQT
jgi:hypothetical protein